MKPFLSLLGLLAIVGIVLAFWWSGEKPPDPKLIDPRNFSFKDTAGRKVVDCGTASTGENAATIFVFGQSTVGNFGDPHALHVPGSGVYNFNVFDGRCYQARDPLLGAEGDSSNFVTRLADKLVQRGAFKSVLVVPIAYGGSPIAWWAPGGTLSARLDEALKQVRKAGLKVTFAIWQQGEADSYQPQPDGEGYKRSFRAMLESLRRQGLAAPIFVAQSTVCQTRPIDVIRQAQRDVVDAKAGVLAGADTDVIRSDDRFDGCHLTEKGLERAAELWFEVIVRQKRDGGVP